MCACADVNCVQCDGSRTKCVRCSEGYGTKATFLSCDYCNASTGPENNCLNCDGDAAVCNKCAAGFALTTTKKCQPCLAQCLKCEAVTLDCFECEQGYGLNQANSCEKCVTGCTYCQFDNALSQVRCYKCETGKVLSADYQCVSCSAQVDNCYECISQVGGSGGVVCTLCGGNNVVVNGRCQKVCQSESADGKCTECDAGYFLSQDSCKPCGEGPFATCRECTATGICLKGCATGCASCTGIDAQKCLSCASGYTKQNGVCEPCSAKLPSCVCGGSAIAHCLKCSTDACSACADGYKLVDGECERVDEESSLMRTLVIVFGTLTGALLVSLIVAASFAIAYRSRAPAKKPGRAAALAPKADYMQSIQSINDIY